MNTCPNCNESVEPIDGVCPECGEILSVADDTIDEMVQAASIPNLASLFQAGKDKGLIKAASDYGSAT